MFIADLNKELTGRLLDIWQGKVLTPTKCEKYRQLWRQQANAPQDDLTIQSSEPPLIQRSYLINLKRRPDRLETALKQFEAVGITPTIFEAVDGHKLPLVQGDTAGKGAMGCLLSHLACLQQAILEGLDTVAIYEDDVVFCPDFQHRLQHLLTIIPPQTDMIYLGSQHREQPQKLREGLVRCKDCHRNHATVYPSLRGMKRLYQIWLSNLGNHADHILKNYFGELYAVAAEPFLCGQGEGVSDVSAGKNFSERWWDLDGKPRLIKTVTREERQQEECKCKKTANIRKRLQAMKGEDER